MVVWPLLYFELTAVIIRRLKLYTIATSNTASLGTGGKMAVAGIGKMAAKGVKNIQLHFFNLLYLEKEQRYGGAGEVSGGLYLFVT